MTSGVFHSDSHRLHRRQPRRETICGVTSLTYLTWPTVLIGLVLSNLLLQLVLTSWLLVNAGSLLVRPWATPILLYSTLMNLILLICGLLS